MGVTDSSSINYFSLFVLPAVAALGAWAAAIFTYRAAKTTAKATIGNTLLTCLDKYISIMKDKRLAIEKNDARLAKEFYRELFDLHWSEFHLWQEGAIPDYAMKAWLAVRKRNFEYDKISVKSAEGDECNITYAEEWRASRTQSYFEIDDPYIYFMDTAHSSEISNIKLLKKDSRRRTR